MADPTAEKNSAIWVGGKFPTAETSPFNDKYDIEGEKAALADLLASDDDVPESDPRFGRFMMLVERIGLLRQQEEHERLRQHADAAVPDNVARGLTDLGRLQAVEEEFIMVNTYQAYRMFIGRKEGNHGYPIPSGVRAAGAVRDVTTHSLKGNPYADWALIQFESRTKHVNRLVRIRVDAFNTIIKAEAERGLRISLMKSEQPAKLPIGFQSAYGYLIADLILDYDLFICQSRTLETRNRVNSDDAESDRRLIGRSIRSAFHFILTARRNLAYEQVAGVTRADFISADIEAKKRVYAANRLFGMLPREVLTGKVTPSHHSGQFTFSEAEAQLLETAAIDPVIEGMDLEVDALAQEVAESREHGAAAINVNKRAGVKKAT